MRSKGWFVLVLAVAFSLCFAQVSAAQHQSKKGHVEIPESSVAQVGDNGVMAHTHLRVMMPEGGVFTGAPQPSELPPFPGLFFETPASIACIYRLVPHPKHGCNPNQTTDNPTGGSGAIAIVDAFDTPNAAADLAAFSAQFGLPPADFTVVFASGTQPGLDPSGGWELETSLDIEWSHAMAPNAKIFLVEAANNRFSSLFPAVILAANLVAANGGGEVSMSWGSGEFTQETQLDGLFTTPGVVYIASSGDSPGAGWPSASPNVISAGGTTLSRDPNTGEFLLENTWQDAGGGPSQVEPRPHFQDRIAEIVGDFRGTPDFSFDANPNTGVWVLDTNLFRGQPGGWFILGGTSVSAPSLAGIINAAGKFASSSQGENALIYSHLSGDRDDFRDIRYGTCGLNIGNFAVPGWDFCTGIGSDIGLGGK
ncbi:MAG TPA: S53 family peptidase [Candidatus Acidoferrum sp.]|nr:S53 family peptidase [Candidatus Acidoferrum sp.]